MEIGGSVCGCCWCELEGIGRGWRDREEDGDGSRCWLVVVLLVWWLVYAGRSK